MVEFKVIGLMSGTSMDGLDLAYVKFKNGESGWSFEVIHAQTMSYSSSWLDALNAARFLEKQGLAKLNLKYGSYLGSCVQTFLDQYGIRNVDFVASHGHTIHHNPEAGITVQIGDGPTLSEFIKIPVVNDFRIQDVLLGGQGAPLVPIGDRLLFGRYDACLNLGGFSNISFERDSKRIAFDIGPANIVLNHLVKSKGISYDQNGDWARSGVLDESLLNQLHNLEYYSRPVPKSLGVEWVEDCVYPLFAKKTDVDSLLRTVVEHSVFQIAKVCKEYGIDSMLVTGGGVYNSFFMERLNSLATPKIIVPEKVIVEFKEALVFAFLGVLKWKNQINVLKSVTGAKTDHSSGKIYIPN